MSLKRAKNKKQNKKRTFLEGIDHTRNSKIALPLSFSKQISYYVGLTDTLSTRDFYHKNLRRT